MKIKFIAILFFGMVFYSCSPKLAPTVNEVKPPLSPELEEGKNLFENNCAKCHKLYNPSDFSAEEWTPIVLRMQKQAKIQDSEREKIYNYLTMK